MRAQKENNHRLGAYCVDVTPSGWPTTTVTKRSMPWRCCSQGGETKRYQAATVLWSSMHGICSMAVTGKPGIIIS